MPSVCDWTLLTDEGADALVGSGDWIEFPSLSSEQLTLLKNEIRLGLSERMGLTVQQIDELVKLQAQGGIDTEAVFHKTSGDMLLYARDTRSGTSKVWLVSCFAGAAPTAPASSINWPVVGLVTAGAGAILIAAIMLPGRRTR
jgi:hypothetical protein